MEKTNQKSKPRHPLLIKKQAIELRKRGKTHREIVKELGISLGSAHLWTGGVVLSVEQKIAIKKRRHYHKFTPKEREIVLARLRKVQLKRRQSDSDLLEKIRNFYKTNGRIPLKREFNALKIFRQRFGSWNNAIRLVGFDPNPVLFAKKFISRDGHKCDSFTEKVIDDLLSDNNIQHQRNFCYPNTKYTADFFIEPNIIIEFFGLAGVQKAYDKIIKNKKDLCKKLNLELIELYPAEVYHSDKLSSIIDLLRSR